MKQTPPHLTMINRDSGEKVVYLAASPDVAARIRRKIEAHRAVAVVPPAGTRLTVTVEEAAALMGVSRDVMLRAVKQGLVRAIQWGGPGSRVSIPYQALVDLCAGVSGDGDDHRGTGWDSTTYGPAGGRRNTATGPRRITSGSG